jgi:hypothetical protein
MKIQLNDQNRKALLHAAAIMQQSLVATATPSNGCQHPRHRVIGMFPKTTGGKETCLECKHVRYQFCKDGPWKAWRAQ